MPSTANGTCGCSAVSAASRQASASVDRSSPVWTRSANDKHVARADAQQLATLEPAQRALPRDRIGCPPADRAPSRFHEAVAVLGLSELDVVAERRHELGLVPQRVTEHAARAEELAGPLGGRR